MEGIDRRKPPTHRHEPGSMNSEETGFKLYPDLLDFSAALATLVFPLLVIPSTLWACLILQTGFLTSDTPPITHQRDLAGVLGVYALGLPPLLATSWFLIRFRMRRGQLVVAAFFSAAAAISLGATSGADPAFVFLPAGPLFAASTLLVWRDRSRGPKQPTTLNRLS